MSETHHGIQFGWKFPTTEVALPWYSKTFRQSFNSYCLNCDCFLIKYIGNVSSITIILYDIHNQEFPTLC